MENISGDTLDNYCRACLKHLKREKFNIQSLDLQIRQWLQDATLDNPLAIENYPNNICRSCRRIFKDHLEFRKMCARSRKTVEDIINGKNEKEYITNSTENTATRKEIMPEELQVTHFLRIDMVENTQDVDCNIKNVDIKEELEIEEPLVTAVSPSNIKNEKEVAEFDTLQVSKNDNKVKAKNSDDDLKEHLLDSEGDNSDSEGYVPKDDPDYSSSDESFDKEDKNKASSTNGNMVKKYLNKFRCDQCKYRAISQQCLDFHKRSHLGLKRFQCSKCEESFNATSHLIAHLKKVHKQKEFNFICEYEDCGKKFKSTCKYKEHYRRNHAEFRLEMPTTNETTDKSEGVKKRKYDHICEECGKKYPTLQNLKEHQFTHGPKELYPYKCKECDKTFNKRRAFKVHQLRHAGIKNFECSYCGAKKTTKKELNTHVNIHTKARQYPCPNCHLVFYLLNNLRVHVEVVHKGIRRFACRYCDKAFGKGDNLRMHELLHTGEKPHQCQECGQRFVQRVQLRSHMRTHNK